MEMLKNVKSKGIVFAYFWSKMQCFWSDCDCWWLQQFPARCHCFPLLPSTSLPSCHLSLAPGFRPLLFMFDKFRFLEGENLNDNLFVQSSLMPGNPCQPSTTASPSSLVVEDFQDENTWICALKSTRFVLITELICTLANLVWRLKYMWLKVYNSSFVCWSSGE